MAVFNPKGGLGERAGFRTAVRKHEVRLSAIAGGVNPGNLVFGGGVMAQCAGALPRGIMEQHWK